MDPAPSSRKTPPQHPRHADPLRTHAAFMLWVIRENIAAPWGRNGEPPRTSFDDLCHFFRVASPEPGDFDDGVPKIRNTTEECFHSTLRQLFELGFVAFVTKDGERRTVPPTSWRESASGRLVVTEHWLKVQKTLGVRLSDLARMLPGVGAVVQPLFGPIDRSAVSDDVFVIMPFAPQFEPIYERIRQAVEGLGLTCVRGDSHFSTHAIVKDVWSGISGARLIVADCTGANPNVFYEIGLAHTVGIPTVLLTQRMDDIPFDVRHIRAIQYEPDPASLDRLSFALRESLQFAQRLSFYPDEL